MKFDYVEYLTKHKNYLENERRNVFTTVRKDYYSDFESLCKKLNEPKTKAFDMLLELLYDEEILKKYIKRLKDY